MPDVTELLNAWSHGDPAAMDRLIPLIYGELRKLAHYYLEVERSDTLQSTALVHEAYLRLVKQDPVDWQNRSHFFGVASRLIRQVLVDQARRRNALKRGSGGVRPLRIEAPDGSTTEEVDLLVLDDALTRLAYLDERQSRIVELRFFGGLSVGEVAAAMGISERTVKREWASAKAWLLQQLTGAGEVAR